MTRTGWTLVCTLALVGCACVQPRRCHRVRADWEWSDEQASAAWCARHRTGPRYTATLDEDPGWLFRRLPFGVEGGPTGIVEAPPATLSVFEGPVRITIHEGGDERWAWKGWRDSVWHVVDDTLFYVEFCGGIPGGFTLSVDLRAKRVLWKSEATYPMPAGWSLWSNRKTLEVRGDLVYVRSLDGGVRHLEILDRRTGGVLGSRCFDGATPPRRSTPDRRTPRARAPAPPSR